MNPPSIKSGSGALSIVTAALLDDSLVILLTAGSVLERFRFRCVANSASRIESNSTPVIIFFPLILRRFPVDRSLRPFNIAVAASTRYSRIVFLA